jgi:hypothetical protein
VSGDLTARVAGLAAAIEAHLAEDEIVAQAAAHRGAWWRQVDPGRFPGQIETGQAVVVYDEGEPTGEQAAHIARNDPARAFRRIKVTRDLAAGIMAEQHEYIEGDSWFSCSQAASEPGGEPGSGCSNDERAGKPCDCGRDARVARLLGIIASEWEGA